MPPALLADLLDAVGDWRALLSASLRLALALHGADRGLALALDAADCGGRNSAFAAVGLSSGDIQARLHELSELAPGARRYPSGLAGAIACPSARIVLAVEREPEFAAFDEARMAEMLSLLQHPFAVSIPAPRCDPPTPRARRIAAAQLPLAQLDPFPQLREVEFLLVREALKRSNTKKEAAAALGMTTEGLRRKLIRFGLRKAPAAPAKS